MKTIDGKDIIFLQDGEVTEFNVKSEYMELYETDHGGLTAIPWISIDSHPAEIVPLTVDYSFTIRVVSSGEYHERKQYFEVLKKGNQVFILFEISNGQTMALPYNPESEESENSSSR